MLKNFNIKQMPKDFNIKNLLNINGFVFFKKVTRSSNDSQTSPVNYTNDSQISPANYIKLFTHTTPVELVSDPVEEKNLVIATAYKQVFGNAHLMERSPIL